MDSCVQPRATHRERERENSGAVWDGLLAFGPSWDDIEILSGRANLQAFSNFPVTALVRDLLSNL